MVAPCRKRSELEGTASPTAGSRRDGWRLFDVRLGATFGALALLTGVLAPPARAQSIRQDFYITNGTVNAVLPSGNSLYVGGSFSRVGPVTGAGVPLDQGSGAIIAGFPIVIGQVNAVAADGSGGWFIGGLFSSVGGQSRTNLAHVLSDNSVSSWNPGADGQVLALALSGSVVYAGGAFANAGGQARSRLAAIDASSAAATSWNPGANDLVRTIVPAGGVVYVGGRFTNAGGVARNRIAAISPSGAGAATSWDPNASLEVFAIAVDGSTVYAGGSFSTIGGASRARIAALSASTGAATSWNPSANSQVSAIATNGTDVFIGGLFTVVGSSARNRIASVSASGTGAVNSWNANAGGTVSALVLDGGALYVAGDYLTMGAQPRSRLAAVDPASGAVQSWDPSAYGSVFAIAAGGGRIYAGGIFSGVGGLTRNNLAAIDLTSGAATSWDPNVDGSVLAVTTDGTSLFVGGTFANVGGAPRANLAAVSLPNGTPTPWNPGADGQVAALDVYHGVVYAGGLFANAGGASRSNLVAIDATSGIATGWNPGSDGQVFDLEVNRVDAGVLYLGGVFSFVGSQPRENLAAVDIVTGNTTSWDPEPNGTIREIAVNCGIIYVSGFFTTIGGQSRSRVASLDAGTGNATSWDPNANGPAFSIQIANGFVYVGGIFSSIGGQSRNRLAALDATTGLATPWNPNSNSQVRSVKAFATKVYAGGSFGTLGSTQQANVAAIDADNSVACPAISVGPTSFPAGVVGSPFAQAVTASGGLGPYCYGVTEGMLPPGLFLSSTSGTIWGTPTQAITSIFTVTATDSRGCTGNQSCTIDVFEASTTARVAPDVTGLEVNPAHACVSVPIVYTRTDGIAARGFSIKLQIDTSKLALCSSPGVSIQQGPWLDAFPNALLQVQNNGGGAYTVDGSLLGSPCGPTSGGTLFTVDLKSNGPDGSGAITITSLKVRDCNNASIPVLIGNPASLPIQNAPVVISPATLPNGTTGVAYSQTLTAAPGTAPFTFTVTSGSLPSGLTLTPAGLLSGSPSAAGSYSFTVGVSDTYGCVGSRAYSVSISCPAFSVMPPTLLEGTVGTPYSGTLVASGSSAPRTWTITSGALPDGLLLDSGSGAITGTPTTAASSNFAVHVTDANGCTASRSYLVTIFADPITNSIAANASGLCLSPAHSVALPFVLTRTDAVTTRAFTVTLQLDASRVAIATPGDPLASVHPGAWFTGFPIPLVQVSDNGGGTFTVDMAIAGLPCGPTTGGTLFTVDVVATGPDGSAVIAVTGAQLRNCDNDPIGVLPGPNAALTLDSTPGPAIADLAATGVATGNGTGGTTAIRLTWTGSAGPAKLYRAPFGTYPEYDDLGGTAPDAASAPGAPWTLVNASATSPYVDSPGTRGYWYYVAFGTDECGNLSTVSNRSGGTLDYVLGDVSNGVTRGLGNNVVSLEDITLLGANYGIGEPDIGTRGVAYLDVGPTSDATVTGRPLTDDLIDFEDLIVFASDYTVSATAPPAAPASRIADRAAADAAGPEAIRLEAPSLVHPGADVEVSLRLHGEGRLQGLSTRLAWDASVVAPVALKSGGMAEDQGGILLSPGAGRVDVALLGLREHGLTGDGEIARFTFRVLRTGDAAIRLDQVLARDAANRPVATGALDRRDDVAPPSETTLLAPGPNPFRTGVALVFALAHAGPADLAVYSVDGRRVRSLATGPRAAGVYHEVWDGRDESHGTVAPGVYYVRLSASGRQFTTRLVYLR